MPIPTAPFVSLGAEQQKHRQRKHFPRKKLSIKKHEIVELFVVLDELDEALLKKAITFIWQRLLESAEENDVEVELIVDITEADQDEANCKEIKEFCSAQGGAVVVGTLEHPTESTTPCATTTETITAATETTVVKAPVGAAVPSPSKARGIAQSQMEQIQINSKSCFSFHKKCGP